MKKWYVCKTNTRIYLVHEDDIDRFSPPEGWFDTVLISNDMEEALRWIKDNYVVTRWRRILRYSYIFN